MPQEKITRYDHKKIESTWKENWYKDNIYKAVDFSPKPKKYILAELPYPSGKSLHVGHAMRYTVPEMYSRFLRMQGYNVMFPMGWDAFGLPTEMYAIKNNVSPQDATERLAVDYKKAMMDIGYGIDWDREINTTDPNYYKWTQWLFLKFYENGLAEYKDMPVWYSPTTGILAEEEVINGVNGEKIAERDGSKVERKMFKQWALKIPSYAEKLLEGLDQVDFQEHIKNAQRNWIGKSEGAEVKFALYNNLNQEIEQLNVFTTRPDTLFGVTFLAIAPEHPIVDKFTKVAGNQDEISEYISKAKNRTDMERQTEKSKSGVKIEGFYAKHPFNEMEYKIPIYVSDYILMGYGTGSIMGVPAHDERDYDFAKKFGLKIIEVIKPQHTGEGTMINSAGYNGLNSREFYTQAINRLENENNGKKAVTYKIRDWIFSRQRYWGEPIPIVHKSDGSVEALVDTKNAQEVEELLPLALPICTDYSSDTEGMAPLGKLKDWTETTDKSGNPATREIQTMPTWAGSSWYFIRYTDPKNKTAFADFEKMRYWLPVDKYFGGAEHTTVHLLYSRFWFEFFHDLGLVPHSEPYKWRMSGGLMLGPDGKKMSKRLGNIVEPGILIENYGADATRLALAFIGPYTDTYPWNQNTIKAMWRLVKNIYDLKDKVKNLNDREKAQEQQKALTKSYNKMLKNITEMCEVLKMNTAISEIMIFVNALKKVGTVDTEMWKGFVKAVAPFTPFVAEELWQEVNGYTKWEKQNSVHLQTWPKYDNKETAESTTVIPVMINGKVRGQVELSTDEDEKSARNKVESDPKLQKYLENKEIAKFIYLPGKIASILLK